MNCSYCMLNISLNYETTCLYQEGLSRKERAILQSMSTMKFSPEEESEIFSLLLLNFLIYLF